ncbi:NADAR family protein [Euzebyella marina]|uniref:NADAR family protein n=1 Tax=Euzebyella marina TaxID=1761453 RepID=A0A3G2LA22_9FLAO|nr:NADAR family protein [Euzebyella marina]AYN69063.1 NADAR family protein [Euzebyella marina]
MKITERTYNKNEVVFFKSTKANFGGLSNMAPGYSLRVNDIIIPSAEALYQACRFPLFPAIQQEIIEQNSPMTAKMKSRKYLQYTRQDWEEVKYSIMYWVLKVKLSQNFDEFSKILINTNSKAIVELSDKDKDWAAVEVEKNLLVGKNALGRLLMQLREEYIHNDNCVECVQPIDIFGFLLYGSEIETVCSPATEFENNLLFDLVQ